MILCAMLQKRITNINNRKLSLTVKCSDKQFCYGNDLNSTDTCLVWNLSNLFNELDDFSSNQKKNFDIWNCKYYNTDEIQSVNKLNDEHTLSLFDVNACSLSKNIEDLDFLFDNTQIFLDVIAVTERRIGKNKFPVNDINFTNYSYEYCSTESSPGGTLLYIENHPSYNTINDLRIYKTSELEPTFIALTHLQVVIQILLKWVGLNLTKTILFLTI